jgi:hypothetical protein
MAPLTYVLSRGATDAGDNVFAVIARSGLFRPGEVVEVEHDPVSHQLRRLRRAAWDEAARPGNGAHYEVLLRPMP